MRSTKFWSISLKLEDLIKDLPPYSKFFWETTMLGEALRLVRVYHDLSQSELCSELGVSNSYISEIEGGKKQPTLELLQKYSEEFSIPVSSLLFFSENLDDPRPTDRLRTVAAKQVIALLQWVENKNARKHAEESGSKKGPQ